MAAPTGRWHDPEGMRHVIPAAKRERKGVGERSLEELPQKEEEVEEARLRHCYR